MKKIKNLLLVFALATLAPLIWGCALAIPVHQNNGPKTLGEGGIELSLMYGTSPAVGPQSEEGSNLATLASETSSEINTAIGLRGAIGITERIDIEYESFASVFGGSSRSFAAKYQFLGLSQWANQEEGWSGSARVRYFAASGYEDDSSDTAGGDTLFDSVFLENLKGNGFVISLPFGYSFRDWFLLYLGPTYITMNIDYSYRDNDATGTKFSGDRTVSGYGGFAGLQMNSTGKKVRVIFTLEADRTTLPSTYFNRKVSYTNYMTSLGLVFRAW